MFISFSGLDGTGKSTQIGIVKSHLKKTCVSVKLVTMYDDISMARKVRYALKRGFLMRKGDIKKGYKPKDIGASSFRMDKNREDALTIFFRLMIYTLDISILWVKILNCCYLKQDILIFDRFIYDSLVNLLSTKKANMLLKSYCYMLTWLAPKPECAFLLEISPEEAFRRKPEYPLEYMRRRREAYKVFWRKFLPGGIVIPSGTKEEVSKHILEYIDERLLKRRLKDEA